MTPIARHIDRTESLLEKTHRRWPRIVRKKKKNNIHQDAYMQLINKLIGKRKIWMRGCNYNK